jgi:hypothetical protein
VGFYARRPGRLVGQVLADLFVVGWTVLWWFVGRGVDSAVAAVAGPSRNARDTTRTLALQVGQAAEQAGRVPALGGDLRRPFDEVVRSLDGVAASADEQVNAIERAALVLGWAVFLIPVLLLLVLWLPARVRFFLRSRAAQRFIDAQPDLDLFALRAMVAQPMHVIARISDDPVTAWRQGDRAVINALADVELRRSGLRRPEHLTAAPPPT